MRSSRLIVGQGETSPPEMRRVSLEARTLRWSKANGGSMTIIVEPTVSKEKLLELLAERAEQPSLDYKKTLNLGKGGTHDAVELAKDVAAMQAQPTGGYVVIGVDDHGTPVGALTPELVRHFDEATVGRKLATYLSRPEILVAQHEVDGHTVVVLYVAPSEYGWCIFNTDGTYAKHRGDGKQEQVTVFRVGDVFVRHGTSSERWTDADRDRLVSQIVERRKESWRSELTKEFAAQVDLGLTAQRLEAMSADALALTLDLETFDRLATEFLRRGDDIPIRRLLNQAPREAVELLNVERYDDLRQQLNRLTSLAALCLHYDRPIWLEQVIAALERLYGFGFDEYGRSLQDLRSARLWVEVAARVEALGALAVRRRDWPVVRKLADRQPTDGHDTWGMYAGWLRHALTMASRNNLLGSQSNMNGLLALAHNVVREVPSLYLDVATAENDGILTSLCQFDFYACLIGIDRFGSGQGSYYPNFALFYSHRITAATITLLTNPEARHELFKGNDALLAQALRTVDEAARREGFNYAGWHGYEDQRVNPWITEKLAESTN